MNLYFQDTDNDQDPTNFNNWWDTADVSGTNGYTPSGVDDCIINSGVTCTSDDFSRGTLVVNGTLTTNNNTVTTNYGTVNSNNGTVTTNYGTVNSNNGTVNANYNTININYGTVSTNVSGGTVFNHLYGATIINQNGTLKIGTVTGGTGNMTSNGSTDLSSQTAGINVVLRKFW